MLGRCFGALLTKQLTARANILKYNLKWSDKINRKESKWEELEVRKESEGDQKAHKMYIYVFIYMHIYFPSSVAGTAGYYWKPGEKIDAKKTKHILGKKRDKAPITR